MPPFPTSRFLMLAGGAVISNRNFKMHHHHNISLCDAKKSFDDCMNPACKSTLDLIKMMNMKHKMKSVPKAVESPPPQEAINPYTPLGCPADRDILGQGTWQLIHTIAANYPPEPTKEQKQNTFSFLQSLSKVYPCPYCAADFQARLVDHPPKYVNDFISFLHINMHQLQCFNCVI